MEEEIINLFQKYMDRKCNPHELEQVLLIIEKGEYQKELEAALGNDAHHVMNLEVDSDSSEARYAALNQRILYTINREPEIVQFPKRQSLWTKIAVAAAILLVASLALYLYTNMGPQADQNQVVFQNDIAPGKNGATLTLADGQKILIKDALAGNIATQSGVKISKTADGQIIYEITNENRGEIAYNTLSTTRGEQTKVRLPDGTLVFLKAESSLKYPTSFTKQATRRVSLTGEGYFEVARNKAHPFIVNSQGQDVQVLGTHFNINAYNDQAAVKTTLLEGSVKVNGKILRPNEQSTLVSGQIRIKQVDVDNVVAWKNGMFLFEDETLSNIMRKIERWYDVEVVYTNGINKNELYGGGVSRYDNVSKVLEKLTLTGGIHFKIERRKITVMK